MPEAPYMVPMYCQAMRITCTGYLNTISTYCKLGNIWMTSMTRVYQLSIKHLIVIRPL